jgi:hypothetical protein
VIIILIPDRGAEGGADSFDNIVTQQPRRSGRQPHHPQPQEGAGGHENKSKLGTRGRGP